MTKTDTDASVRLDLNNPVFQEDLLTLQKPESRHHLRQEVVTP